MMLPVDSVAVRFAKSIFAVAVLVVLVACGGESDANSVDVAAVPNADSSMSTSMTGAAADGAISASAAMCAKATFAEVSAAAGGNFDKVDVIDEKGLNSVDCVYLDSKDLYNGFTISFVSNAKLVASASKWQTAAAYFDEWSRGGTPVANLGERAAWIDLPAGLLVLSGDQALHFSGGRLDPSDSAVRARIETLAHQVFTRMP